MPRIYGPLSDIHKARLSLALKGRCKSPEHAAKISFSQKGKSKHWAVHPSTLSRKGKTYEEIFGLEKAFELKRLRAQTMAQYNRMNTGKTLDELYGVDKAAIKRRASGEKLRGRKLSAEHIRNILRGLYAGPNKAEQALQSVLERLFPEAYRFVGRGDFILGNMCPDFMNVNGQKKLIEFFGSRWHSKVEELQRIDAFEQFGFATLVIWDFELADHEKLDAKLIVFHEAQVSHGG